MAKNRKIRALIIIGLLLVGIQGKTYAQSYYIEQERTFSAGAVFGTNFTQIDGDQYAGYHNIGLNFGGIVYAKFSRSVSASMELLYSQKGCKSHKTTPSNSYKYYITDYNAKLNYVEIPFMIQYSDKRNSHIGIGASFAQLLGTTESGKLTEDTLGQQPIAVDFEDYPFKKFDINILVGGTLHLYKGLYLNLRYQYSLMPIRTNIPPEYGRDKQYNNMWTLRLMYLFE